MVKWSRGQTSQHVDDRRGRPTRPATRSSGGTSRRSGSGIPIPAKAGLPVIIVVVIFTLLTGGGGGGGGSAGGLGDLFGAPAIEQSGGDPDIQSGTGGTADDELEDFMRFVVDDVQETWTKIYADRGQRYEPTTLVLFSDAVRTGGCGDATSAVGPFYCPADSTAYIDLNFYKDLRARFGAPGDFAQAYVIAHEIGHHIQNLTGDSDYVRQQRQSDPGNANEYSIALELQADCLAGIWTRSIDQRGLLEDGDIEEGLGAAEAVGDDRIQEQATGTVNPETWTHGSSDQRMEWFLVGFDSGDPDDCNTFRAFGL